MPKGWGPNQKKLGPEGVGQRKVEASRVGAQNFALSLPFPVTIFALLVSLWESSRGFFGGVWKSRGRQMFTFGVLGSRVKPRRPRSRLGFTRQPGSPNVHMSGSRPSKTTKIQRERPPEREERMKIPAGERKKKSEILGLPPFGAPTLRAPTRPSGRSET